MTDLDQLRADIAGMTPGDYEISDDCDDQHPYWRVAGGSFYHHDQALLVSASLHALEIQQRRKWWCEWDEGLKLRVVHWAHFVCGVPVTSILYRDDGTLFTGPDPVTPLIEANAYYKERGR